MRALRISCTCRLFKLRRSPNTMVHTRGYWVLASGAKGIGWCTRVRGTRRIVSLPLWCRCINCPSAHEAKHLGHVSESCQDMGGNSLLICLNPPRALEWRSPGGFLVYCQRSLRFLGDLHCNPRSVRFVPLYPQELKWNWLADSLA